MKRIAIWALVLLFATATAWARPVAKDAADLVKETSDKMLSALDKNKQVIRENPNRIYDLVSDIVLPHFDFTTMARSVLGKYWNRATPAQQKQFTEEFRNLLVRTYASSLSEYSGQQVKYLPLRAGSREDEVTVRTEIQQQSGFPIPVEYDLKYEKDAWKVVGVTIDGLNLVLNYRTSFGNEIRAKGLETTIADLAKLNRNGS